MRKKRYCCCNLYCKGTKSPQHSITDILFLQVETPRLQWNLYNFGAGLQWIFSVHAKKKKVIISLKESQSTNCTAWHKSELIKYKIQMKFQTKKFAQILIYKFQNLMRIEPKLNLILRNNNSLSVGLIPSFSTISQQED